MWQSMGEGFHLHPSQTFEGQGARIFCFGEHKRQFHIFDSGERVNQLESLKDKADLFTPQVGELRIIEGARDAAIEFDFARRGEVHCAAKIEQCRFATAAAADERDEIARAESQRDRAQRGDLLTFRAVNLGDISGFEKSHTVSGSYGEDCGAIFSSANGLATLEGVSRILVTGGAGYIGSHTRYALEQRGHSVIVVDNLSRGYREAVPEGMLRQVDTRDKRKLIELLRDEPVDAAIHFAAYISVGESTAAPELYFENNVSGSLSLFEAMLEAGVKRVVFSSTAAAYGIPKTIPIPEDETIAPINPYGESKVMVERILTSLDRYREFRSIRLRYFNACGAAPEVGLGERHDPETHLIPLILKAVRTGKPVTLFGDDYPTPDGTCIRDYIHVMDLADAHILAVENLLSDGHSDVLNVGTGVGHSVKEVLAAVEKVTGQKAPFTMGPRREGDPPSLVADSRKLQGALGWEPVRADLERIVADAWAFMQTQPV